jgi:hypothetical protein
VCQQIEGPGKEFSGDKGLFAQEKRFFLSYDTIGQAFNFALDDPIGLFRVNRP